MPRTQISITNWMVIPRKRRNDSSVYFEIKWKCYVNIFPPERQKALLLLDSTGSDPNFSSAAVTWGNCTIHYLLRLCFLTYWR